MSECPIRRMTVKNVVNERFMVSDFYVFFLIFSNVIGIGILNFQREIAKDAGYDAWLSIILTSISIHMAIWLIYKILEAVNNDIIFINQYCFGKWIGWLFNCLFVIYFFSLAIIVYRVYIEVVQVWMFPLMNTWQIGLVFLILIYYIVSSGFRVIAGICFWGTVIPLLILPPLNLFAIDYADINNILPLFNHSLTDILGSSKTMFFQYLGFEAILMFYPFLKKPEKSKKWAHLCVFFITLLYLYIAFLTFLYFSEEYLKHTNWPSISIMKIAEFPIIERFEIVVVSIWFLLALPNICIKLWAACRGARKITNIKQRTFLILFLILMLCIGNLIENKDQIQSLSQLFSKVGLYLIFLYLPVLYLLIKIKKSTI